MEIWRRNYELVFGTTNMPTASKEERRQRFKNKFLEPNGAFYGASGEEVFAFIEEEVERGRREENARLKHELKEMVRLAQVYKVETAGGEQDFLLKENVLALLSSEG